MARILFLATHPKEVASTRYRVLAYEAALRRQGHEVLFHPFFPSESLPDIYARDRWDRKTAWFLAGAKERWDALSSRRADLIFIHRELFPLGLRPAMDLFQERLRRLRVPLIYDFDDAVFLPHRQNRGFIGRLENPAGVSRLIGLSDAVIAGNSYLASYALRFNPAVRSIPTPVDTDRYFPIPRKDDGALTIGWIGSPSTAKYLFGLAPVFERLARRRPFRLKVIGAGRAIRIPGVEMDCRPWDLQTEAEEFRRCDIGVYPLWDDEWSRGKCGYKALQFMASGVPVVAADVGMNREILRDGVNGLLARTEEEWERGLSELMEDAGRRCALAEEGRRTIEERYSLRTVEPRFLEVTDSALSLSRKPEAAGDPQTMPVPAVPGLRSGTVNGHSGARPPDDILCFSSIDWDFVWQGHQEIMTTLARQGHRVLFVENTGVRGPRLQDVPRIQHRVAKWRRSIRGFSQIEKNLYVFSPLVLPFPYSRAARWVNRQMMLSALRGWMQVMDFHHPVCWTFLPTPLTLELIHSIPHRLLVYYCIDSFVDSTPAARRIAASEQALLSQADLVFVTSKRLEHYASKTARNVHLFPFGVSLGNFERARENPQPLPREMAGLRRPIIGYVGGLHQWVDQELVCEAARAHPEFSFVFVGPLQTSVEKLRSESNVVLLGQRPHHQIPDYIRHFDAGIIPYRLTDYTSNVYPTKLNEYLAMGKPVVSTALPEVQAFSRRYNGLIEIGAGSEGFRSALRRALETDTPVLRERREEAAKDNDWGDRIASMQELIREESDRRASLRGEHWVERLERSARTTSRLRQWAAAAAALLFLTFCTPLAWWAARPLRLPESLGPADAIVVFAGGVGESGLPEEGYQEVLARAVELHRRGLAQRLLLVSGYTWTFREADVMSAMARDLGVPVPQIITETRVASTLDYVRGVRKIAEEQGWGRLLLVTSPYHGKRAVLTFARQAPKLEILPAPLKESRFYAHEWGIRPRQLKGLLHEALGILYYRLKGWL